MFKSREKRIEEIPSKEIDTLIGEKLKLIGKIVGKGNIRIDGEVEGDIDCKGDITISETGIVNGNINCSNIYISGTVKGNVITRNKLTLFSTGKLKGDIEVESIIIHDNGFFQGKCTMRKEKEIDNTNEQKVVNKKS